MTSIPERGGNRLAQLLEARFCLVIGPAIAGATAAGLMRSAGAAVPVT